jgi:hypothetical protein
MKKTLAIAAASVMLLLAFAGCNSFSQGYNAGKCGATAKDEETCKTCCQAAIPDGQPPKFTDKCHCVLATGQVL